MKLFRRLHLWIMPKSPYIFVLAVFVLAVSPSLLSEGMFMDGLIYSTLAHNLSQGIGSFWHLSFSETVMRDFYGHPPLAIFLQSWIYTVFGDAYWVDKLYSFFLILVQVLLLQIIWKEIWRIRTPMLHMSSLWVMLLFLLSPLVIWASTNNLLENTLVIFELIAVWCYLYFKRSQSAFRYAFLALSGISLALGFLCKSFVGLFVWGLPLAWWISDQVYHKENKGKSDGKNVLFLVLEVLTLIICTLLPLGLLFSLDAQANLYAHRYWMEQIMGSFNMQMDGSRWYLLKRFIFEASPVMLLFGGVLVWKKKKWGRTKEQKSVGILFLLLFIFGTLPLLVSLKQRTFYLLTAWPFFTLGLAAYLPMLKSDAREWKLYTSLVSLILAISLCFVLASRPSRQADLLQDVHQIIKQVPPSSIIRISPKMTQQWSLYGYLARYAQISLDHRSDCGSRFLLLDKHLSENQNPKWLKDYDLVQVPLKTYRLYRMKEVHSNTIGL